METRKPIHSLVKLVKLCEHHDSVSVYVWEKSSGIGPDEFLEHRMVLEKQGYAEVFKKRKGPKSKDMVLHARPSRKGEEMPAVREAMKALFEEPVE